MKNSKKISYSISITILSISVLFWILLLFDPINLTNDELCHVPIEGLSPAPLQISKLMIGWTLMVFAMMLPKLITPIQHVYEQGLKRKRLSSALLFIFGYAFVWIVVGFIMNLVILGLNLIIPISYIPAIGVGVIGFVWQFSPVKQRFLNLGHGHRSLRAFGWAARFDALKFGIMHGVWCFGSGWALMWFPMLLTKGHYLAMIIVTFIMISEHMEHPQFPRWCFNFRLKLLRILIAQTKIRFKQILESN